ncbi:MAG TPA: ABC transporter permease [Rhodothermales bacterium]|nr:ABC transporter permease [Rhodothermales bacterium]
MGKVWIVLKSEFLRRVTSKWFIVTTILIPVLLIAVTILPGLIGMYASQNDERTVAVVDQTGVLLPRLQAGADESLQLVSVPAPPDILREEVRAGAYDGLLILPDSLLEGKGGATFYSSQSGGLSFRSRLQDVVSRAVQQQRLAEQHAPPDVLQIVEDEVSVQTVKLTETGEEAGNTELVMVIGFVMGFAIYISVLIYGAQVMYGAMEEKSSRVVEVVISSVRPFDLLLGKVLGIGAMGLVQLALWCILAIAGLTFGGAVIAHFLNPADFNLPADASQQALLSAANLNAPSISPMVFVWFVLFFLGAYLLYASLLAAVGASVEQHQDAQSLMMPITLLIMVPIIFMTFLLESPNSTLAIVMSMIPFFSPILMVVRVAITDVPLWQTLLAFALLAATFIFTMWLSARIYRVGILMYGKKPTLKDLARWVRYA